MYTKSIAVSALLAVTSLSAVGATPAPSAGGKLQRRCVLAGCSTTSKNTSNQSSTVNTSNNNNVSNQS
ncbi:hypothetical protein K437DRAFT_271409, partial [Tilletiaria anomala UBC 951]